MQTLTRNFNCPAAGIEGCSVDHGTSPHPVCPNCGQWQHNGRYGTYVDCANDCAARGLALRVVYPRTVEGLLHDARIALAFYRQWMADKCPGTDYPFGVDVENAIAKAEGGAK